MDDKIKEAYEAGYRAACMDNNIPYVGVRHIQKNILQVNVAFPLLTFLQQPDCNDVIAHEVIKTLDKWYREHYLKKTIDHE